MTNLPNINELKENQGYLLLYELDFSSIKDFLKTENKKMGTLHKLYLGCLFVSIATLSFIITVTAFKGSKPEWIQLLSACIFSFSFLIVLHELCHALLYKLSGAPNVTFGGSLKKFTFYAASHNHIINGKQYILVALAPFCIIFLVCLSGFFFFPEYKLFFIITFCLHNFFCSGDFAFINLVTQQQNWKNILTYDDTVEKKAYFYSPQ